MNIDEMPAGREMDLLIINSVPSLLPEPWESGKLSFAYKIEKLKDGPIDVFDGGGSMIEGEDGEPYIIWTRNDRAKGIEKPVPHYSTDIADAWKVVEKMRSVPRYYLGEEYGEFIADTINIYQCCSKKWCCLIGTTAHDDDPTFEGIADTAPLAICRAALKALGVEE